MSDDRVSDDKLLDCADAITLGEKQKAAAILV